MNSLYHWFLCEWMRFSFIWYEVFFSQEQQRTVFLWPCSFTLENRDMWTPKSLEKKVKAVELYLFSRAVVLNLPNAVTL